MKKVFAVLMLGVLLVGAASAQEFWGEKKMSWGGGVEVSLPMGDWGDAVGIGFGGFGKFQYGLNADMTVVGSLGYTMWSEKETGGIKVSGNALTVLGGLKYKLATVTPGFYAIGEVGIYNATVKVPAIDFGLFTMPASEATESKFVIAPGVGMEIGNIDVSAKYVISGDVGNIAIRAAYQVPL